jgi:peptidoglycan hydrolase FlgJ
MDPLSPIGAAQGRQRLAQQLESTFATDMLRSARPQKRDGMFDRGIGSDSFDSFMDEAMGEAMTQRGGLGLAPAIEAAMAGRGLTGGRAR